MRLAKSNRSQYFGVPNQNIVYENKEDTRHIQTDTQAHAGTQKKIYKNMNKTKVSY